MSRDISDEFSRASILTPEPFRKRFLLAWQAYERIVGRKVDGQAFAAALGVSRPLVSAWQEADEPPPHARIREIAKVAHVDPGWLAYGAECAAAMDAGPRMGRSGGSPSLLDVAAKKGKGGA